MMRKAFETIITLAFSVLFIFSYFRFIDGRSIFENAVIALLGLVIVSLRAVLVNLNLISSNFIEKEDLQKSRIRFICVRMLYVLDAFAIVFVTILCAFGLAIVAFGLVITRQG